MDGFGNWVEDIEKLITAMGDESLTGDEYKDMLAKFQVRTTILLVCIFYFIF